MQREAGGRVGDAAADEVADVLDLVWGGAATLIVVSTDLSHYEPHHTATAHDARTAAAILACAAERIGEHDACGALALRGLLVAACRRDLAVTLLDLRTSGDTAGPRDRVVSPEFRREAVAEAPLHGPSHLASSAFALRLLSS